MGDTIHPSTAASYFSARTDTKAGRDLLQAGSRLHTLMTACLTGPTWPCMHTCGQHPVFSHPSPSLAFLLRFLLTELRTQRQYPRHTGAPVCRFTSCHMQGASKHSHLDSSSLSGDLSPAHLRQGGHHFGVQHSATSHISPHIEAEIS